MMVYFNKKQLSSYTCIVITILLYTIGLPKNLSAQTWQSELLQINQTTGELTYTPDPTSGVRIPDFSRAGYKGGGVPLPTVPVKLSIDPIDGDNTLHIQNAIDSVSSLPMDSNGFRGALLLNSGIYRVYGTLEITTSGVILRGMGRDQDTLSNTHIWGLGNTPVNKSIIKMGGLDRTDFAGMVPGTQTDITSPLVQVGDKKFAVADSSPFQIGDNIIIYHPCTQEWLDAVGGGGTDSDPDWEVGQVPIIFNTRIEKIKCDTIYTNSPVFNTLDLNLSQSYIYKYDREGLIENTGIENLLIDIEYNTENPNDDSHARAAVFLAQLENSWVKNCEFSHFWFSGVNLHTANYITIENCNAYKPKGPTDGGYKYNFCAARAVQNTLFTNCNASEGRHPFVSNGESTTAGIVFHNCTSIDPITSSEGHRMWSTGLLYDNFIDKGNNPGRVLGLYNRGSFGDSHGWASVNSVAWNCDATRSGSSGEIVIQRPPTAQNFAIGCKGIITGSGPFQQPAGYIEGSNSTNSLIPSSLYTAQLNNRNYLEALQTDNQIACSFYTWIDGNTYFNNTDDPQVILTDQNGCDSIVTLNLTIGSIDASVTQDDNTLSANLSGATYQWLDCNNNFAEIAGETNQFYTPSSNGNFAVRVTKETCVNTSDCFYVNLTMLENAFEENLIVSPNPTQGEVSIRLDSTYSVVNVEVLNSIGKSINKYQFNNTELINVVLGHYPGMYIVKINTIRNRNASLKIIRTR